MLEAEVVPALILTVARGYVSTGLPRRYFDIGHEVEGVPIVVLFQGSYNRQSWCLWVLNLVILSCVDVSRCFLDVPLRL